MVDNFTILKTSPFFSKIVFKLPYYKALPVKFMYIFQ